MEEIENEKGKEVGRGTNCIRKRVRRVGNSRKNKEYEVEKNSWKSEVATGVYKPNKIMY